MNSVVMKKRKYGIPEKSWFRPRNHMLSNVQADYLTGCYFTCTTSPFHRLHDVSHPAADLHNRRTLLRACVGKQIEDLIDVGLAASRE